MIVLVCGSRDFSDYWYLWRTLSEQHFLRGFTRLLHGAARGADTMAGRWATDAKVPVRMFPAEWDKYGREAGMLRNRQMLREGQPNLVIAFPIGRSPGTRGMMNIACDARVEVLER